MGRFSDLNPNSPENEKRWESVKDELFRLMNEINAEVLDGKAKVWLGDKSCGLEIESGLTFHPYTLGVHPHTSGSSLVWEVREPGYEPVIGFFFRDELVSGLRKATAAFLEILPKYSS